MALNSYKKALALNKKLYVQTFVMKFGERDQTLGIGQEPHRIENLFPIEREPALFLINREGDPLTL